MDTIYEARFWSHVKIGEPEDCWEWQGARRLGYGRFFIGRKVYTAHRLAFMLTVRPIKYGMFVCHRCDNPPCCNPAHLFMGTRQDNRDDCVAKNRQARGSQMGKLSPAQVLEIRRLFMTREISCKEIEARFGIHKQTRYAITSRYTWKHL